MLLLRRQLAPFLHQQNAVELGTLAMIAHNGPHIKDAIGLAALEQAGLENILGRRMLGQRLDDGLSFFEIPVVTHHDASTLAERENGYAFSNSWVASWSVVMLDKSGMACDLVVEDPR